MTPERWEQVRQLFDRAAELEATKRQAFLQAECGPDAELRAEVERLLAADQASGGFFGGATNVRTFLGAQPDQPVFSERDIVAERFLIVRYIGRGGMGEVYEATDLELHEQVALKTLLPRYSADQRHVSRFRREVHVARKVKHPNVCKIHDVGRHRDGSADITFLTMELLDGETLSDYLKREGKLKPEEALSIVGQMAAGLQALHENDVVHRDFKPGNIILVPSDEASPRPVITDFGLAILATEREHEQTAVTEPGHILGTPDYMAPEHMAAQNVGSWSDIYSFGLVVCKALTGRHPLRREEGEQELQGASAQVLSLLPRPTEQVIRRCLSTISSERPTTPLDVVRAMSAPEETGTSDGAELSPAGEERHEGAARFFTKGRVLAAVSTVLLALVLGGLRLDQQGITLGGMLGGMVSSLQDDLCTRFPGEALFCVLPPDRDIAFQPLDVKADEKIGLAYGRGLSRFIGDSLYRLRANKGEFCFHVRDERQHVGVPLVLSGEMHVSAGKVRIDTKLVRVSDGQVLRQQEFERNTDDLRDLHEGLVEDLAEIIGYELDLEQLASWLAEGPRDVTAFADYLTGLGLLEEREYEQAGERFRSALGGPQGGLAFTAAARGLGDANRALFAQTNDVSWAREA
ncbi:MAG: protein kinase, partial [Acidobacteria bacterium]|nr:protein kinase [Acidobacteriota bacterium]